MKVHVLKCWPHPFAAIVDGSKPFEWRSEADRKFNVGDLLLLLEYRPKDEWVHEDSYGRGGMQPSGFTGELAKRRVTYVLREQFDMPKGFVVMGLGAVS